MNWWYYAYNILLWEYVKYKFCESTFLIQVKLQQYCATVDVLSIKSQNKTIYRIFR